jgi:geranylgeranyl diphosphate synthase type II
VILRIKPLYLKAIAFSEKKTQLSYSTCLQCSLRTMTKIESVKDIFNNSGASKANQDAIKSILLRLLKL